MTTRLRSRAAPVASLLASAFACTAIAWSALEAPKARMVYNATDSVPIGWYRIETAKTPLVGSIVLAELPAKSAALAGQRGYLPARVPLLKSVGAMAPQHVCTVDGTVHIDGVPVAALLSADRFGRPLPSWTQCRRLLRDEVFLLSPSNPASFDSRYFGPIPASSVHGVARPIWVERLP